MEISLGNIGNTEIIYIKNTEKNYPYESKVKDIFKAEYLETLLIPLEEGKRILLVGLGRENVKDPVISMEISAKACKELKKYEIKEYSFNIESLRLNKESFVSFAKGIYLSVKPARTYKSKVRLGI